jgi:hypothetical protein
MAQTKERQESALTLAAQRRDAEALILRALSRNASANSTASLHGGWAAPLAEGLAAPPKGSSAAMLGQPLSIRQAAELIGCSPWTVRQKLLPRGLPHFRSGASGRLIFYEAQVVRWIASKQK